MIEFVLRKIIEYSNVFFMLYLLTYSTYLLISNLFGSFMMYRSRRLEQLHNELDDDYYYPMSIIVPAYNENVTAIQTIRNLCNLDYRQFEIIVVDDGSTDHTKQLVIDTFDLKLDQDRPIRYQVPCKPIREVWTGKAGNVPIILISKENGKCKADASNAAINVMTYPYFVCMDADEVLQKDALTYAARAILAKDDVIAVGGNVKISNSVVFRDAMPVSARLGRNLISDMQILEYSRAFVGSRIFRNLTNTNLIISGGFGVFKKDAVVAVGGYDTSSMGEDMELTMKLHRHYRRNKLPYHMEYEPDSVCWTQAPATIRDLKRQRERWHCGLMQNMWKYRGMLLNPHYGLLGLFTMPFMVLYELLCSFFIFYGWFIIISSLAMGIINMPYVLMVMGAYFLMGVVMTVTVFVDKMNMKNDYFSFLDIVKAFGISLLDSIFFRPWLFVVEFLAFFKYKKTQGNWVSPARVQVQELEV